MAEAGDRAEGADGEDDRRGGIDHASTSNSARAAPLAAPHRQCPRDGQPVDRMGAARRFRCHCAAPLRIVGGGRTGAGGRLQERGPEGDAGDPRR